MLRHPNRTESRAILIGTSEYLDYDPLPAVANNLNTLREIFINARRGGFLPDHCHMIQDPIEASVLAKHVKDVADEATDVLLVYCSGHGIIDPKTGQLHLALKHTEPSDLHYTAIPVSLIQQAISESPATIKVFILESCWSGRAIAGTTMGASGNTLQAKAKVQGAYTLTSSPSDEVSLALDDAAYTAFSEALIRLLESPPEDYPAGATMAQLYPLISQYLQSRGCPAPQQSVGNRSGDLALIGWDADDEPPQEAVILTPPSPFSNESGQPAEGAPEVLCRAWQDTPEPDPPSPDQANQRMALLLRRVRAEDSRGGNREPGEISTSIGMSVTEMIRLGGPTHQYVLYARDIQCYWWAKAGRIREARDLLERILGARTDILGPDHLEVLNTRQYFAHITGLTGDHAGAVAQFRQLWTDRERVNGRNHSDTQVVIDFLAYWTGMSGNFDEASKLYQKLHDERDWLYGPMDKLTLDAQEKLGDWLAKAGRNDLAWDTYSQLHLNWEKIEGSQSKNAERAKNKRDYCAEEGAE